MEEKGKPSALRTWLLLMASLVDDILVLALVFLGLWYFHVKITWAIILVIGLVMAGFVVLMHNKVIPALRLRRVTGREAMLGLTGRVVQPLAPHGEVIIKGEYWQAESIEGRIEKGDAVEVVGISGLKLEVRKKRHD